MEMPNGNCPRGVPGALLHGVPRVSLSFLGSPRGSLKTEIFMGSQGVPENKVKP